MNAHHTLGEVGRQFSVARERIRQIEAKGERGCNAAAFGYNDILRPEAERNAS